MALRGCYECLLSVDDTVGWDSYNLIGLPPNSRRRSIASTQNAARGFYAYAPQTLAEMLAPAVSALVATAPASTWAG